MLDNNKLRDLFFKKEDITHPYFNELCLENKIDNSLTAAAVLVPIISNQDENSLILVNN